MIAKFSKQTLINDILYEAKALGLRPEAVKTIAVRAADGVEEWTRGRAEITEDDLARVTARELDQYNKDLGYAYNHRNKII